MRQGPKRFPSDGKSLFPSRARTAPGAGDGETAEKFRTYLMGGFDYREPVPGAIANGADRQHDKHLDKNTNNGSQRSTRTRAKQGDGARHGKLKEVASSDQCSGAHHFILDFEQSHQTIRQRRIKIDLQRDWQCDQENMQITATVLSCFLPFAALFFLLCPSAWPPLRRPAGFGFCPLSDDIEHNLI